MVPLFLFLCLIGNEPDEPWNDYQEPTYFPDYEERPSPTPYEKIDGPKIYWFNLYDFHVNK